MGLPAGLGDFKSYAVPPLQDEDAKAVIAAAAPRVELEKEQMKSVLRYCGGHPLALQVVAGALVQAADTRDRSKVFERLASKKGVVGSTGDPHEELRASLLFSIELLPDQQRKAWLDIVMLFREDTPWQDLVVLFSETLEQLLARNLLQRGTAQDFLMRRGETVEVEVALVHDVLVHLANSLCGPSRAAYLPTPWSPNPALRLIIKPGQESMARQHVVSVLAHALLCIDSV
jgi:hypothetical protein